jgi:hypothetical protein
MATTAKKITYDGSECYVEYANKDSKGNVIQSTYAKLTDTYTKAQIDSIISTLKVGEYQVVASLPSTGEEGVVYLVGSTHPYVMYIWENSTWLKIGTTEIDLSSYVPVSRKVNGHELTKDISITSSDVGLGLVINASITDDYTGASSGNYFSSDGAYKLYQWANDNISFLITKSQDIIVYSAGNGISIEQDYDQGHEIINCLFKAEDITIG